VAVVLLVMSFASKGVVPPDAAYALVLGANLGTAINPCLEGTAGSDPASRRVPLGNLINRGICVVAVLALLTPIGRLMVQLEPDDARSVADFHTLFNLAAAAIFLPLLPAYARLMRRLLPARVDPADPGRPMYLDPGAYEAPAVALGGAAREALRLSDVLETMLQGLRDALDRGDRRRISQAKRLDDVLDRLNTAIRAYLTAMDTEAMTEDDHRRVRQILTFATSMEHAGDVVENNLLAHLAKKVKRGLTFSPAGQEELAAMVDRLMANLRTASALFVTADLRTARLLAAEKETFRDLETKATNAHFERLRAGRLDTAESSSLHLDMLRDLKRVNAHLVEAAAYPVLEAQGELLPTRLREQDEGVEAGQV
jgi:phosphate:Na+ symporter